jgi:hypothetical protein
MLSLGQRKSIHILKAGTATCTFALLAWSTSCKPRAYNDNQTQSKNGRPTLSKTAEAQAQSLLPFWPVPQNISEVRALPMVTALGVSTQTWQKLLSEALSDSTGRAMTLSNPECALSADSWRISAARLALYEIDLPGSVTSWQTFALQRETDLSQRVQLHVSIQPWCTSQRLGRGDFIHTLDHAFLLTFDLSTQFLSKNYLSWLEELLNKSNQQDALTTLPENKVLPFARALLDVNDGRLGRSEILRAWNQALLVKELTSRSALPSAGWTFYKQQTSNGQMLAQQADGSGELSHPALKASSIALNNFFNTFVSEKNLIRVRAHVTEGLGSSQRFLRWERQESKIVRFPMQTVASQWDRSARTVSLNPLLSSPQKVVSVGTEQPVAGQQKSQLLRDVDLEATPLANDIAVPELLSLNDKIVDSERTSVHSTRCVSCHGLDDALRMARDGRPVSQRGIAPAQLTLFGVSADGKQVTNTRTMRAAEGDARRNEEEAINARQPAQR